MQVKTEQSERGKRFLLLAVVIFWVSGTYLFAQQPMVADEKGFQTDPAAVWHQLKSIINRDPRPVLLIRLENRDYESMRNFAIVSLFSQPNKRMNELLGAVHIVCLREDYTNRAIPGTDGSGNVHLLSPTGEYWESGNIDYQQVTTPGRFAAELRGLLESKNGRYLASWEETSRQCLAPLERAAVLHSISQLNAGSYKDRRAAKKYLHPRTRLVAPLLYLARNTAVSIEQRESIIDLFIRHKEKTKAEVIGILKMDLAISNGDYTEIW